MSHSEIIILDKSYDRTLIIGDPENASEQKIIRVNSGVMKLASPVWNAMLSSPFAERTMSEIPFPDDSPQAFLIILQIAHFYFSDLPEKISQEEFRDLAVLCDKYDTVRLAKPFVLSQGWLLPYKEHGGLWQSKVNIIGWVIVADMLKLEDDYEYLVTRLAMMISFQFRDKERLLGVDNYPGKSRFRDLPSKAIGTLIFFSSNANLKKIRRYS